MIQSDFKHDSSPVNSAPAAEVCRPEYVHSARLLISEGHCTLRVPPYLKERFWRMVSCYADIAPHAKAAFSFPDRTDGFLPFGMERARSTNRVDLCERFCFRQRYRLDHQLETFANSVLYEAAAQCEAGLSAIAEHIMNAICAECESMQRVPIRDNSYLQFCSYDRHYRRVDREYLQDRHEDGNLITLVMASREGLVIFPRGIPHPVSLADDEFIIFTGSLLTILSDGRIPSMDHAVLNPSEGNPRSSLVYFAVPDLQQTYATFAERKQINLESVANELHQGFGNRPFTDRSNS